MRLYLQATDPALHSLCRDLLQDAERRDWELHPAPQSEIPRDCDLFISEITGDSVPSFQNGSELPRSIFIINRAQLLSLREQLLTSRVTVLLKPVNKARLDIAIEHALSRPGEPPGSTVIRLDRDELLQHLFQTNLKLQDYDQERSRFLARAVHELRAPLTCVNGYCGLLAEQRFGPLTAEQSEVLDRMRHSLDRLSGLVSSLFQLSVGQDGNGMPDLKPGQFTTAVEQALHEMWPAFQERRIDVHVQLVPPPDNILYDSSQMERVFINLFDNCCKFTPRGGSVRIKGYPFFWERRYLRFTPRPHSFERRHGANGIAVNAYRVDISDTGPGIPAEQLDKIFEEYTAFGNGTDRSGAGLGLSISRMIVNAHKGRIWAESPNGNGAMFSVVLPYAKSDYVLPNAPNGRAVD